MAEREITIGKSERRRKFPTKVSLRENHKKISDKKSQEESKSVPKHIEKKSATKETRIEEGISSEITPSYEVLNNTSAQVIKITVSDKDFLKAILEELNRNLKSETGFKWNPLVWCEDSERITINAIAKINENNIAELENLIDEIKSNYNVLEIQK